MGRFPGSSPGSRKGVSSLPGRAEVHRPLEGHAWALMLQRALGDPWCTQSPVRSSVRVSRTDVSVRKGRGLQAV